MPGPPVVVCQGDTVVAELINKLHTETTSMHFHGSSHPSILVNVVDSFFL